MIAAPSIVPIGGVAPLPVVRGEFGRQGFSSPNDELGGTLSGQEEEKKRGLGHADRRRDAALVNGRKVP